MFDQIKKGPEMWKCGQRKNLAYLREYWTISNDFWCAGIVEVRGIRRNYVRWERGENECRSAKFSDNLISSRVLLRFGRSWVCWNRKNEANSMQLCKEGHGHVRYECGEETKVKFL